MAVIDQIRTTIAQHNLFAPGDWVVVGVSGGPDSLTLLHVLHTLRREVGIELHVAHLNHQLRGEESDADAQFVAWLAKEWRLPATIQARDVQALARERHWSIEEAARHARYEFLIEVARRIGAHAIAVAHNADDQVETLLMHFLRGAGLAGLRGMQYKIQVQNSEFKFLASHPEFQTVDWELRIVRPLLDVTRAEIETYCRRNYLAPRFDLSNLDATYFRNRLRNEALPYLETLNRNLRQTLIRASHALADDFDFIQRDVHSAYAIVARPMDGAIVFDRAAWRALHPAIQRGTLRAAVQQLRGSLRNIDWTPIEDARRVALEKSAGAQATLPGGLMLRIGYDDFTIADAERGAPLPDLPLLYIERMPLLPAGVTALPDSEWIVQTEIVDHKIETADRWTALLDFEKCQGAVSLRRRRAGDRFQPAGLGGHTQSLHAFMINEKIPRAARGLLPLLLVDEQIVWVCGWRIDERARATDATRAFWQVSFRKKEKR
jgi:tRNA(Ile)-lysidine synthase